MKTKKECRCNKPELEEQLMKMPELEHTRIEEGIDHKGEQEDEMIHKAMNNINTFQCCEGELYLRGIDEYGKDFQIVFDAYDFLNWIDTEDIEYIKEQLIKHIKTK
jgi:hypothetical protein